MWLRISLVTNIILISLVTYLVWPDESTNTRNHFSDTEVVDEDDEPTTIVQRVYEPSSQTPQSGQGTSYWYCTFNMQNRDGSKNHRGWGVISLDTKYFDVLKAQKQLKPYYNSKLHYMEIDFFQQVSYDSFMNQEVTK